MKKLKYSCFLYGHTYPLPLGTVLASFSAFFLQHYFQLNTAAFILFFILIFILVLIICGSFIRRLSHEEKQRIADAPLLLWQPLPAAELEQLRSSLKTMSTRMLKILEGFFAAAFILLLYFFRNDPVMGWICALSAAACAIGILLHYRHSCVWSQIDETAEYVRIPVHHCFTKTRYTGEGRHSLPRLEESYSEMYQRAQAEKRIESYLVCYLPDGKYVFYNQTGILYPEYIRIIRFQDHFQWIPEVPENYEIGKVFRMLYR